VDAAAPGRPERHPCWSPGDHRQDPSAKRAWRAEAPLVVWAPITQEVTVATNHQGDAGVTDDLRERPVSELLSRLSEGPRDWSIKSSTWPKPS
jgi:hypothetical protein